MFLGYNFEPRPKNHVLAKVSSVMTIDLSVNRRNRTKKNSLTQENKKFRLRLLKRSDVIN